MVIVAPPEGVKKPPSLSFGGLGKNSKPPPNSLVFDELLALPAQLPDVPLILVNVYGLDIPTSREGVEPGENQLVLW